jgi:hypothetical protein
MTSTLRLAIRDLLSVLVPSGDVPRKGSLTYTSTKHHLPGKCGWAPVVSLTVPGSGTYNMACYMTYDESEKFGYFADEEYPSPTAALDRAREIATSMSRARGVPAEELVVKALVA